jgi:integrase
LDSCWTSAFKGSATVARTVRDSALDTRTARTRLKPRGKPYYRAIDPGLHLGYRRSADGGKWVVRVYLGRQSYRVENIATADDRGEPDGHTVLNFSQAQARARARMLEMTRHAAGLPAEAGPYTVGHAVNDYVAWMEQDGRSAKAVSNTRQTADAHIIPKLASIRLDRLTRKQIQDWLSGLAKAPPRLRVKAGAKQRHRDVDMSHSDVRQRRQSTSNRIFTVLKAALNKAWRDDKVASDKAWRSVQPFKGADVSRARYLQSPECQRLINAATEDFRQMVRAGLHTGCRWGELCRLTTNDFNEDAGTLAIRTSKSGRPRHVVLTDQGARFFAEAVARAHGRQVLFTRADGEAWRASWQTRPMKLACRAANIKPAVGFHVLRHSWASLTVMGGAPLLVVARNLGHTTTRMVERHYGHLSPSFEADAIRAAAPRFGEEQSKIAPIGGRHRTRRPLRKTVAHG